MKKVIDSFFYILLITVCCNCSQHITTEKHQGERDKIVNVHDKVKEIVIEDVLIGQYSQPHLIDNYLLINDYRSPDEYIHLFDKKTFKYLTSTAYKGEGPDEITVIGHIGIDEAKRKFYATDHGKLKIFSFALDSVLANPLYTPQVKMSLKNKEFPSEYYYINDTLCFAVIVKPTGDYGFNQAVAKWNMTTGEIKPFKYAHPEVEKMRVSIAVSVEDNICVECFHHHDLMTICTLDGDLKYNIYGNKWNNKKTNDVRYYNDVVICGNKIIAATSLGRDNFGKEYLATTFLVFDLEGNYLQTLETGYQIVCFCYDKEYNRIIMVLDDDIQFAYLDLDGVVDVK